MVVVVGSGSARGGSCSCGDSMSIRSSIISSVHSGGMNCSCRDGRGDSDGYC